MPSFAAACTVAAKAKETAVAINNFVGLMFSPDGYKTFLIVINHKVVTIDANPYKAKFQFYSQFSLGGIRLQIFPNMIEKKNGVKYEFY